MRLVKHYYSTREGFPYYKSDTQPKNLTPSICRKAEDGKYHGYFWGLEDVFTREFKCMSVQGLATILKPLLLDTNVR